VSTPLPPGERPGCPLQPEAPCLPTWPSVEAHTKDGKLVLRCDLPGVDPSDIDVSLEGTTLTISGERRWERTGKEEGAASSPLPAGHASRKVPIQIETQGSKKVA